MDRLVEIIMNTSSYFSWRIKYQVSVIWPRASKVGTWFVCNACALGPHSIGVYLANETCYQWHDSSQTCQGKIISKPVLLLCQHPFSLLSYWTWAYCWSVSEDRECIRVASERTYKRMRSISTNMFKSYGVWEGSRYFHLMSSTCSNCMIIRLLGWSLWHAEWSRVLWYHSVAVLMRHYFCILWNFYLDDQQRNKTITYCKTGESESYNMIHFWYLLHYSISSSSTCFRAREVPGWAPRHTV